MPERTPYIAANWKMHKTVAEAAAFVDALLPRIAATQSDVVICPPFTALTAVVERRYGTAVKVAAQNMHEEGSGAFTGEVSAPMLVELDVEAVVLGHSERRQYFAETDEALARKVPVALAAGLEPILCVGESEEARDADQTEGVLERQLQADLAAVESVELAEVVVAYEPIWAIGTGRTATPRAGPGGVRLHPRRAARARRRRRRRADPLRRLGQARQRRRADGAARHRWRPRRRRQSGPRRIRGDRRGGWLAWPSRPSRRWRWSSSTAGDWPPAGPGNAISLAETPVFDRLWSTYPHTELSAQGRDVGLPDGQMGNSEVGHLNLGAGAIVKQDLARIDDSIADGSFFENEALLAACDRARRSPRGRLHLLGLVSDGGVHSGWEHIEATIELASQEGVPDVVFHAFTDGRDTLPHGGRGYLGELERWLRQAGRVATVSGRYYAMDRDTRWERIKLAYDAIVHARGQHAATVAEAIDSSYEHGETDEFVKPTVIGDYDGATEGDVAIFINFRPDRAREMTRALAEPGFDEFSRTGGPELDLTTMTVYRKGWPYPVVFPEARPETTLAEVVSEAGGRQLHVAETEKYAHVTYFFNGGREEEWEGEERCLVDSPRDVPTYDHKPEMSARAAADTFVSHWSGGEYRFGIVNFANPDMVGHTGVIPAAVEAVEEVDGCLGDVVAAVEAKGGACIVTADHGNCDHMLEPDGSPNTAHSLNPVPLVVTAGGIQLRDHGILADVAPTALQLLGIPQPEAMTGKSLLA